MSLPRVEEGVAETVMAQYLSDQKYNEDLWNRMVSDNPEIFIYIQKMRDVIAREHGEDAAKGMENCAGILYRILENQDEANELEELIGG